MIRAFGGPDTLFPGRRLIATLGMFDGVHRGHQAVLRTAVEWARRLEAPCAVLTFDVHPRSRLGSGRGPDTITSLEHRLLLFEQFGLDAACVLPFDETMAALPAEAFVRQVLA